MSPSISASWVPAQLSRNEAQAHTTIAQRAWELPLHCGASNWLANLRPVIQAPWSTAPEDTFASIEWAGALLQLQLPAATTEQLMSALLDTAALPDIPEEMQTATLQAALSDLLTSLERLGRGAPQLIATTQGQPPAALPHSFIWHLTADSGDQAITGLLRADSLGLLLMAGLLSDRPAHEGPLISDDIALQLKLDIGYSTLSALELQQLGLGDVLLMKRSFLGAERVLWLQAPGAGGLHVQLPTQTSADDADGSSPENSAASAPFLTVVQSWTHAMPTLEENPSNEAASFDAIPLRLSFDLGELSLTLAQLRALQPGQTIRLEHPIASAVRIRANGALIGEGDLVDIDGHLGVSVCRLFATSAAS